MFSNFKVKAAHQAESVGERNVKNTAAPLSTAQVSCKTWISGLHTLENLSPSECSNCLQVPHDHYAQLNSFRWLISHLEKWPRVDLGAEEKFGKNPRVCGASTSTPSSLCTQNYALVTMREEEVHQGGGLARDEEHTRSLRKKYLFKSGQCL